MRVMLTVVSHVDPLRTALDLLDITLVAEGRVPGYLLFFLQAHGD